MARAVVTPFDVRMVAETRSRPSTPSLLVQLGAHAAARFAGRLAALKLVPAHAAMIEILAAKPGMSQCALAELLGTIPSRMVTYVDELEGKGLLKRRPHKNDRRNNALFLTKAGHAAYRASFRVAQQNQQALLAGLSTQQQTQLAELLRIVANQQGLASGPVLVSPRKRRVMQHDVEFQDEHLDATSGSSAKDASGWMSSP